MSAASPFYVCSKPPYSVRKPTSCIRTSQQPVKRSYRTESEVPAGVEAYTRLPQVKATLVSTGEAVVNLQGPVLSRPRYLPVACCTAFRERRSHPHSVLRREYLTDGITALDFSKLPSCQEPATRGGTAYLTHCGRQWVCIYKASLTPPVSIDQDACPWEKAWSTRCTGCRGSGASSRPETAGELMPNRALE